MPLKKRHVEVLFDKRWPRIDLFWLELETSDEAETMALAALPLHVFVLPPWPERWPSSTANRDQ